MARFTVPSRWVQDEDHIEQELAQRLPGNAVRRNLRHPRVSRLTNGWKKGGWKEMAHQEIVLGLQETAGTERQ